MSRSDLTRSARHEVMAKHHFCYLPYTKGGPGECPINLPVTFTSFRDYTLCLS
jgi:hypothetical protein